MNTMANHGFINHSGRDLYVPDIMQGLAQGMNIGFDFTSSVAGAHFVVTPDPYSLKFDMNVMDFHNFPIEHDMSYSRRDAYFTGDDYSFWPEAWNQTWNAFEDGDLVTIKGLADARTVRKADSEATNPTFLFGPREVLVNLAEAAIILEALGESPEAMTAPKSYFEMFFTQEKLPYELGWRPSPLDITLPSIFSTAGLIFAASNETVPEGLEMTPQSYKDALEAVDPVTGLLANTTQLAGL